MYETREHLPLLAEFSSFQAAQDYRAAQGGWLFVRDAAAGAVWFDAAHFTPSRIFTHSVLRGQSGKLI